MKGSSKGILIPLISYLSPLTSKMINHYTLHQLNALVRKNIEQTMPDEYWVEAEVAELHESGGHCYIDLIQKDPDTNTPVARASARCWRSSWVIIKSNFVKGTGQQLAKGMKALLRVFAQFHENYGFSWIITDIDPTYTVGDMAMKRAEIIRLLKSEGVFEANRELSLPLFAQRIAVISSASAAGYGDFCNQLADNPYGYKFQTQLFPSIMQGEGVEQGVIEALNHIFAQIDDFDCVVIARGGGATSDLSGFDTLQLARNVANFPLPIITGIGHERDESVLDMISFKRVKTPTAAADFLIDHLHQVDMALDEAAKRIAHFASEKMSREKLRMNHLAVKIPSLFAVVKTKQTARLDAIMQRLEHEAQKKVNNGIVNVERFQQRMISAANQKITHEKHRIEILQQRIQLLDPQLLLQRGYSITLHDGHSVRDPKTLPPGAEITTRLQKGTLKSVVK